MAHPDQPDLELSLHGQTQSLATVGYPLSRLEREAGVSEALTIHKTTAAGPSMSPSALPSRNRVVLVAFSPLVVNDSGRHYRVELRDADGSTEQIRLSRQEARDLAKLLERWVG